MELSLVSGLLLLLFLHGWMTDHRATLAAEIRELLPPPALPTAPGIRYDPPHVDSLPLLPWEPLTESGKAYRARQMAYRRAQGLPLDV